MWIAREIAWLNVLAVGFGFSAPELHSDIASVILSQCYPIVLRVNKGMIVIEVYQLIVPGLKNYNYSILILYDFIRMIFL